MREKKAKTGVCAIDKKAKYLVETIFLCLNPVRHTPKFAFLSLMEADYNKQI